MQPAPARTTTLASVGGLLWSPAASPAFEVEHCSWYRALLICLVFCLPVLAWSQAANTTRRNGPSKPSVRAPAEVVNVYAVLDVDIYAVVEDRNGRLVENLTQQDFVVREDGARQQISYFSRDNDAPITLGIVFDTSPSQGSVLSLEQQQAKTLVRQVLRPRDSSFIVQFDQRVELIQDLTCDQDLLARAIDATVINQRLYSAKEPPAPVLSHPSTGGSHLYDAIALAVKLMANQSGRKVLVLLTDGEDLGSEVAKEQALENAAKADVIVYAVAVTDKAFYQELGLDFHGDSVLKKFCKFTGGRMSRGTDSVSTSAAFHQIGEELRGQYLLRFTPTKSGDGSFRKIKVQVPGRRCTVRTRTSYYSQSG